MKLIVRLTALVVVSALSLAPDPSPAGTAATPPASNCFFVRNHLPCPCPSARGTKAMAHAARVTASALGSAVGATANALTWAERNKPALPRNASQPMQTAKR